MEKTKHLPEDQAFLREVNEEVRQEHFKNFLKRFKLHLVFSFIILTCITSGFVGYHYWHTNQMGNSGDILLESFDFADQGKIEKALENLNNLQKNGAGAYPILARMKLATLLSARGDKKEALDILKTIAQDSSADPILRDTAKVRTAFLLVDLGSYSDVVQNIESISDEKVRNAPLVQEMLGLSSWKEGKVKESYTIFRQLVKRKETPQSIKQRSLILLELICGSGRVSCDSI